MMYRQVRAPPSRRDLDLDPVRVLEEDRVVARSPRVGMPVLVEDLDAPTSELRRELVHLLAGPGVERKVVQADAAPVVAGLTEPLLDLDEDDVGGSATLVAGLGRYPLEAPPPERLRPDQVGDVDLDVVQRAAVRRTGPSSSDLHLELSGPPCSFRTRTSPPVEAWRLLSAEPLLPG